MKKPYHIVNREEKGASAAIEQFAKSNGQLLLPLVELITQARIAVDEVIGSIGRKTIETILMLSAEEVSFGTRTPRQGQRGYRLARLAGGAGGARRPAIESEAAAAAPQAGG